MSLKGINPVHLCSQENPEKLHYHRLYFINTFGVQWPSCENMTKMNSPLECAFVFKASFLYPILLQDEANLHMSHTSPATHNHTSAFGFTTFTVHANSRRPRLRPGKSKICWLLIVPSRTTTVPWRTPCKIRLFLSTCALGGNESHVFQTKIINQAKFSERNGRESIYSDPSQGPPDFSLGNSVDWPAVIYSWWPVSEASPHWAPHSAQRTVHHHQWINGLIRITARWWPCN